MMGAEPVLNRAQRKRLAALDELFRMLAINDRQASVGDVVYMADWVVYGPPKPTTVELDDTRDEPAPDLPLLAAFRGGIRYHPQARQGDFDVRA